MKDSTPVMIRREDYRPPPYTIEHVDLTFQLDESATRVIAQSLVVRTPGAPVDAPLMLSGQDLVLEAIALDGRALGAGDYTLDEDSLVLPQVPARFELRIVSRLNPSANRALEGLYLSGGNFCTQCEAEGFRRMTWFLDRPDVMARYRTRIEADKQRYPMLLSNGNLVGREELPSGRHACTWEDPFPKPCYLFALVAGDLACARDRFVTVSGREVALEVYVAKEHLDQTAHCLASLARAMRWDEQAFGREYDLDVYMIVAVRDFNMGAMENKGLNIFNTKYVLARADTATDADFQNVEAVVAHEYFHNWSGNRVTCRDWFQLSLKEGFTVFRDQEFSSSMGSRALKRIQDVQRLLSVQFPEDAGPTAHPVRPDSYVEINNFYTPTVYEKGAEVVRMAQTLLGPEHFRAGTDLYFARHDGQAVTCDDFVRALEDASQRDLSLFRRWYAQAGTPQLRAQGSYDARARTYSLTLSQSTAPTPGQPVKQPLLIPVRMGLLDAHGEDMPLTLAGETAEGETTRLLVLDKAEATFTFVHVPEAPVPSLLRGFSAPVRLESDASDSGLLLRMARDSDPYCRWEASQTLAQRRLAGVVAQLARGEVPKLDPAFAEAFGRALASNSDPDLLSLSLTLPSESILSDRAEVSDPTLIHEARSFLERALANTHHDLLAACYEALGETGAYRLTPEAMGRRSLRNMCLRYLMAASDRGEGSLARLQFDSATNMTDMIAALLCLVNVDGPDRSHTLARFYTRFEGEALVIDKWFSVQASSHRATTLDEVSALMSHPAFNLQNPNRARALIDSFAAGNPYRFHDPRGLGYAFLRSQVARIDGFNGQVAARMVAPLTRFSRIEPRRRALMVRELRSLRALPNLSKDLTEQVDKALQAADGRTARSANPDPELGS
jgi:aminopeptidase N